MTRTARPNVPAAPRVHDALHAVRLVALLALVAGLLLPTLGARQTQAQDGGQATIVVTSYQADGVTPLPFARFQVTDSLGNVYPARESAPPDGVATLTVDVIDDSVTYSVAEETPPACGIAPEPQVVTQLAVGETETLSFSTSFEADCDLGSISIYSYTCPDGLDLTITDYAQYTNSCLTTNDNAEFRIAPADGDDDEDYDLTTGEFGIPGRAPAVGLEPGDYLLTERNNESNLASMIFCLEFAGIPGDGSGPLSVEQKLPNADGEVEIELDGGRIACDVFRVVGNLPANTGGQDDNGDDGPDEDAETPASDDEDIEDLPTADGDDDDSGGEGVGNPASIEFHVATCPVGYDGPDYFNTCYENGTEGITFAVSGEDSGIEVISPLSAQPVDPGFGITTIAELPADIYTMSEDVPGEFVEVFVYCADAPGGGPRIQTPQTGDGTQEFEIELQPGQNVICDWYLSPVDSQGTGGDGTATLRLTTFACTPGYGGTSFGEVTSDCVEPVEDVEFNLASDDAGYDVDETTNGDGKVRFQNVPENDDYVLDEDLPGDALDDRIAYCAVDGAPYVEYDASTGTIQLDPILDGQEVQCLWYLIPTDADPDPTATETTAPVDETAILRVTAFTCESGYGGATFGEYTADCLDPSPGVGFELAGDATGYDVKRNTNASGKVRFSDVPPGDYRLTQDVPGQLDALEARVTYCAVDGGLYFEFDVDAKTAYLNPIAAGEDVQCLWYNVPVDESPPTSTPSPEPTATEVPREPGSLRIHKSECPPGQREDFYDDCYEDVVGGIGFNVAGPRGYDETGTTSDQGIVTFDDVPAGSLVVTELQPADYAVDLYVVVCSLDGQPFGFEYDDSTGLRIDIDLPSGGDVICDWYNVPPGPPPTATPQPNVGSITVIVSLCELEVEDVVSFADDCEPYGDGAEFKLTGVSSGSGPSGSGTTGTDSRVVFANLQPGAYALEETSLDWCKAQADSVDESGNVMVSKTRNTNVYIYNCLPDGKPAPGEPGGSKSAIKTLPSTGTGGPDGDAAGRGIGLATWGLTGLLAMTVLGMAVATPALARRRRALDGI